MDHEDKATLFFLFDRLFVKTKHSYQLISDWKSIEGKSWYPSQRLWHFPAEKSGTVVKILTEKSFKFEFKEDESLLVIFNR